MKGFCRYNTVPDLLELRRLQRCLAIRGREDGETQTLTGIPGVNGSPLLAEDMEGTTRQGMQAEPLELRAALG